MISKMPRPLRAAFRALTSRALLPWGERQGPGCHSWPWDENGTILLALVAMFSFAATLGTAMVTGNRASAWGEISANNYAKAHYLAEAGGRYALPRIQEILAIGGDPTILGYTNQRFALVAAGESFLLNLSKDDPYNPSKYILTSTGTLPNDSVSKTIKYDLPIPATILGFKTVGNYMYFDRGLNYAGDSLNPDDWNVVGATQVNEEPTANHPDHQVLYLSPSQGCGYGPGQAAVSAGWANDMSSLPFLSDIWAANDNLLSYSVQTKISLENHDIMAGISFRLTTSAQSASGHSTFYGVSYLYNDAYEQGLPIFSPAPNFADNSTYLLLWKKNLDGTRTILHKKKLVLADGVVQTGSGGSLTLKPMTALIVNVVEKYRQDPAGNYLDVYGHPTANPASYTRFNRITVYLQNSADYLPGEVSWNYSRFQAFTWDEGDPLDRCEAGGSGNCVTDSSYTSSEFATREPDEIGLHSYGYGNAALADYAVFFPPLRQVVQYE